MDNISNLIENSFHTSDMGHVYESIINYIERLVIEKALERSCGNQVAAAKTLGLHRNTLNSKIKKLNIDVERFKR